MDRLQKAKRMLAARMLMSKHMRARAMAQYRYQVALHCIDIKIGNEQRAMWSEFSKEEPRDIDGFPIHDPDRVVLYSNGIPVGSRYRNPESEE